MTIYDCFSFYNEFDILEIRLETLDPIVDYFVLTESPVMFSGLNKPLYFNDRKNEPRFKKFEHKIIHQILLDIPDDYVSLKSDYIADKYHKQIIDKVNQTKHWPKQHSPYGRDTYTKESAIRPLINAKGDDIVMYSDCDEIPNPDTIRWIIDDFEDDQVYNLVNKMYYYYFNLLMETNAPWFGTIVSSFQMFWLTSICEMRNFRRGLGIDKSGWHLSYMGGREQILEKMISGNETSMYTQEVKDNIETNVANCLITNRDIYGRPCKFTKVPITEEYLPKYIVDNQEKFANYFG